MIYEHLNSQILTETVNKPGQSLKKKHYFQNHLLYDTDLMTTSLPINTVKIDSLIYNLSCELGYIDSVYIIGFQKQTNAYT